MFYGESMHIFQETGSGGPGACDDQLTDRIHCGNTQPHSVDVATGPLSPALTVVRLLSLAARWEGIIIGEASEHRQKESIDLVHV